MPKLREQVIHLTKDGIWPWLIPADVGEPWPDSQCHTVFYNSSGAQLADIYAAEITTDAIRFLAQPAEVNEIPAGAKFETFVTTDDGELKIRYGTVQRPEATFFAQPATQQQVARKFEDTLQRTALGWRWEAVRAVSKIYDNSAQSLAYGVGPNVGLFSNQVSAIRYYSQLTGDTVKLTFTIVMPTVFGANNGKTAAVICADQNFTSGLAVEVDSVNNKLNLARVVGPTSLVYVGSPINNTPLSNDSYTVIYNNLTDTLAVYKGASTSPMGTPWEDTADIVPHGGGYRHTGFIFKPTFLETGPQVSGWAAKDEV